MFLEIKHKDLPILIKFIDTDKELSVQVHPDDEYLLTTKKEKGTLPENGIAFEGKEFLDGNEESYGYMIKPFTRDKDGVQSTILVCEAVNYYKSLGKTLVDVLNSLYEKIGYLDDIQENETLPGIEGLA